MDMSKDEPAVYVPMQEQTDAIKYADIQPSPYESPYQQDIYQEQGSVTAIIHSPALRMFITVKNLARQTQETKSYDEGDSKNCDDLLIFHDMSSA